MSGERRLEYEKGPSLEDEPTAAERETEPPDDEPSGRRSDRRRRPVVAVAPWKVGVVSGPVAVTLSFLLSAQLAAAMFASGMFAQAENEPSQWVIAAFTLLGSHGAGLEQGGEPIQGAYAPTGLVTSHVSALVPVAVLATVGYLLVRYVRLETLADAGQLFGTLTASYVALTVAVGAVARWSPADGEPDPGEVGPDPETLSVAIDVSSVLSVMLSVVLFVALGAVVAALPRLLEDAPIETTDPDAS